MVNQEKEKAFINLRNIVKRFEGKGDIFIALNDINLNISSGEYVGIVGKSGCGKTTLLNMICGIDRPTSGEIVVDKKPIQSFTESQMAVWRGKNIGVVFQFFQLLPTLSVLENVMLPMDFCNTFPIKERKKRGLLLLKKVCVEEQADKFPSSLSGGEQQRVAIARALANEPQIIVADEPTGNLDSRTAEMVFEIFDRLVEEGKTVLLVSHDRDIAKRVNRCITLADGKIVDDIQVNKQAARDNREVL